MSEAQVTQAEKQGSLARSSLVMVGGSFASRALGVVRAGLLTAIIGTLAAGDSFNLANTLPNVFYILAAGGILNAVLIPALTRAMKLPDGGQEFTDRVVTVAVIAMGGITILVLLGAGAFVSLLSGDRGGDFERLALAFSFICLPQIFFYGAFALFGQILNAKNRFGAFAWAPFIANVVAVVGLLIFNAGVGAALVGGVQGQPVPRTPDQWTGPMIWLFAGSATISVVAQAAWLLPALYRTGFRYRPRWGLRGVGLGGVSRLAVWAFTGLAVSQLGFFITQWVLNTAAARSGRSSEDPLRATSVYTVAFTIFMLPHAFIAVSIITALFPRLSKSAADDDVATFKSDFRRGMILPLVANVPVMVFVMVAATPIVALLNPGIDGPSIELAAIILVVMILGIVPFGVDLLCYRVFFALEDGRSPLVMQAVLTTISLTAGLITLALEPKWAIAVVAIGQTVGNVASSTTGIFLLRRRLGLLGLGEIVDSTARIGVAAAAAGLLAWGAMTVLSPILGDPTAPSSVVDRLFTSGVVLTFAGVLFVIVYVALAHAFRVSEIRDVAEMVRRRIG